MINPFYYFVAFAGIFTGIYVLENPAQPGIEITLSLTIVAAMILLKIRFDDLKRIEETAKQKFPEKPD